METSQKDSEASDMAGAATEASVGLSSSQRARVERNRQRALLIRQKREANRPYPLEKTAQGWKARGAGNMLDSGGGFFLDDDEQKEETKKIEIQHLPGPIMPVDSLFCDDCGREFMESYLYNHFDVLICDTCRESNKDKYALITKTDAKTKYMLKDADFDFREPALKFIARKNPHKQSWGEMKLFLESQIYDRAMEVWESEDKLDEALEKKLDNREKAKQKKFTKKIKELRRNVRSSLYKKDTGPHQHEYGEETYDKEEDQYSKKCITCSHVLTYEKM